MLFFEYLMQLPVCVRMLVNVFISEIKGTLVILSVPEDLTHLCFHGYLQLISLAR